MHDNELIHYGVKGMKWGVRRNLNNANKDYSNKQRKHDRAFYGTRGEKRINKKLNQGYGIQSARHYEVERREKINNAKRTVKKGVKTTTKLLSKIGALYITDQVFYGGAGTRAAKTTAKYAGRAVVSAYMKARGGWDIRWYDI